MNLAGLTICMLSDDSRYVPAYSQTTKQGALYQIDKKAMEAVPAVVMGCKG